MERKKLNSLQAGRGIAALMVVLYHANGRYGFGGRRLLGHIFTFGFAGVDFFFVLSGFIIAYSSYHLIGQKSGLGEFAKKRFIRVYPIYWLYLAVAIAGGLLVYHDLHVFDSFLKPFLLLPGHHSILGASWTLPFELIFYIVFALLIYSRWALFLIIPMAVISATNAVLQNFGSYGIFANHDLNDLCTPFNVEFLFGVAAYFIYDKINKPVIVALLVAVALTIVLEILYFKRADYNEIYPGQRVLPFGLLAFAAVTAFAALDHRNIFSPPRFFINLGNASYTLYLVHANVFSFAFEAVFERYHLSEQAVMIMMEFLVPFSVYISFVLYKYVEKPLLKRINRVWDRGVVYDRKPV